MWWGPVFLFARVYGQALRSGLIGPLQRGKRGMRASRRSLRAALLLLTGVAAVTAQAASVSFKPRELFRVPFGDGRAELGAKIDGANFVFPRDFTMDSGGHFYLYDTYHHRIARFTSAGKFEIDYRYLETALQVFAHPDSHEKPLAPDLRPRAGHVLRHL